MCENYKFSQATVGKIFNIKYGMKQLLDQYSTQINYVEKLQPLLLEE